MSTVDIHPSAIVAAGAELAEGVKIGPYCVIGPHVKIGARTRIEAHCVLEGHTALGEDNHVSPFCSLGQVPQAPCSQELGTVRPASRITSRMVLPEGMWSVMAERASSISKDELSSMTLSFLKYSKWMASSGQPCAAAVVRTVSSMAEGPQT